MTKNVGIALAIQHMSAMGIRFADGRSDAAVKLHLLEEKDERRVDLEGTHMKATKTHRVARSGLYLPGGEEDYPIHSSRFEATRITSGVTESGKTFEIEDNWRRPGRGLRELGEGWTGSTTFTVKASARNMVKADLRLAVPRSSWPPCHASAGR